MFSRALSIALLCACASALAPLPGDDECALYLPGPGRTSAYDYSLNLLKGNFGYEGQHTCITYEAVNQAYLEARNRILVSQPKGDWKPEDFASVGELVLDISINLARTYGLTYEEIEKGLPLIDTSRTLVREVCPPVFSRVECRAGKYRRLDGLCNNLEHPTWGATNAPFQRLIGPLFADGINAPRISHTGRDLPLSRVVSRTMHPDDGFHDHAGTVMVIAWGQFMDHDYTLTGTPLDPVNRNDPEECCKRPQHLKHPYCNEIRVPEDDYFYRLFGVKCIDFVRGFPSPRPGCRLGSRVPFNTLTGAIDGNTVYGVTDKFARKLRTGYGGLLRMNPVFKEYGLKDLLPLKLDIPDEGCTRPNKNMYCFEAGEIRVNEQLVLTVMHTLMAREHNRVAKALAEVNPHWDDETLYQEARRINIAEIQHITYNEFLPILLGKDVMEKFGLVLEKEGYWDGYDPEVNPDVIASFAAAAYRFGHSLLPTAVERWSKAHKFIASKRLSDLIRRPYDLYRAGVLDEYVMGLMNQVAQAMDDSITQEVTNHLFKKVGARFGMDLVSFNMQRGREFGLPGYMEFRKFCGLSGADSFQDLFGTMSNETVRRYESIFEHPIDVDLWSGGVSERPLPGSMLGPTFACIIATQFSYSRRGDRFWFELPNQPSTFTPEQLAEIRKARLARIICDNTDIIDTVQLYPMVLPDHELNPRVPCRSGIIPSMDFTKWAEPAPFHGTAKQFITDAYIPVKNETEGNLNSTSTVNKDSISNTTNDASLHEDTKCNITHEFNPTPKVNVPTLHITANGTSNTSQNIETTNNCGDNSKNITDDCLKRIIETNEIPKSDTVLKYVYKKNNDKLTEYQKSPGHPLNSLRKRRSVDSAGESAKNIHTAPATRLNIKLDNMTADASENAPLIVNYETSHTPEGREIEVALPVYQRQTENTVQNSALADFNIETLHEQSTNKENQNENSSSKSEEDSRESGEKDTSQYNSEENSEERVHKDIGSVKNDHTKTEIPRQDSGESAESEKYKENSSSSEDSVEERNNNKDTQYGNTKKPYRHNNHKYKSSSAEDSREVTDDDNFNDKKSKENFENYDPHSLKPRNNFEQYDDSPQKTVGSFEKYDENPRKAVGSFEKYEEKEDSLALPESEQRRGNYESNEKYSDTPKSIENSESKESRESDESVKPEKSHYRTHKNRQINDNRENSKLIYDNSSPEDSDDQYKNQDESQSNESNENNIKTQHGNNSSKPTKLQDVDLGDFSYERVQADDNGQIIPYIENDESDPVTNEQSEGSKKSEIINRPSSDIDEKLKNDIYESIKQPIRINGEIKPVVEINTENNESELSDESSKEAFKLNPESNLSAENIFDTNEKLTSDQIEKNHEHKESVSGDLKQQVERIPTDYKHENQDKNNEEIQKSTPEVENSEDDHNHGTLDAFSPKDVNYDEHLKFKFDDVSVKLPEIKLPEDILAYTYEEPSYKKESNSYEGHKNKPKDKFFQYSDEYVGAKTRKPQKVKHDDDADQDHEYYGYYNPNNLNKQNLRKKDDDKQEEGDKDVDLYEKFVRERFGKRGSFEKRSEKLQNAQDLPFNPKLYETVQNLLKKTSEINKEAKKSGDPNAGYQWTLEYGENLK